MPLSTVISAANKNDSLVHDEAWDSMIIMAPDPQEVKQHAALDKGYDTAECRRYLELKGFIVHIPKRGTKPEKPAEGKKYPARRWVIERTGSWHNMFRRLKVRYEVKVENYLAFVQFANAIICFRLCH